MEDTEGIRGHMEGVYGYQDEMTDEFLEWAIEHRSEIESLDSAWLGWQAATAAQEAAIAMLLEGYARLRDASDSEMGDGDLARDIAEEMLRSNDQYNGPR